VRGYEGRKKPFMGEMKGRTEKIQPLQFLGGIVCKVGELDEVIE